ncbi:hypothetical protein E4T56_gene13338 [Termitomyces sp. T112]|nr:hypothetical protein E4T56_gene13338 [Termitomyces sp. T112]KAH0589930.1 hypothetical protein H2248_000119 [Termitomyces sp. 'cryptogamus']
MPSAHKTTTSTAFASTRRACYTCMIGRKKCEGHTDEHGRCATCVRLKLKCLGSGEKPPEWLRSKAALADFREKFYSFLASQGIVVDHSGKAHYRSSLPDRGQQYHATAPTRSTMTPSTSNNGGFIHQNVPYNRRTLLAHL